MEKKMKVNYHILDNSMVLSFDGKTTTIAKGDNRYDLILQAIRDDNLDGIPDLVDANIKHLTDAGLEVIDGLVYVNGEAMPPELSDRVLKFVEEKLPMQYLVKFWNNLKLNPSYNSRQMLFKFLETNNHPITQDGCFVAYRGVRDDFKDCHTGTFDNSIGQVLEMSRDAVDDNPNNTCSSGLHVASYEYAKNFGNTTVEVKVNPKDVVCVPTDYNGTKMRVCKFEVAGIAYIERTDQLVSIGIPAPDDSDYGDYSDDNDDNGFIF